MNKDLKIAKPHSGKRLLSVLFDYLSIALGSILVYFLLLFSFFTPAFGYMNKVNAAKTYEKQYNLNLGEVEDYDKYEKVIQDFYFTYYPEEIKKTVNDNYKTDYSIVHIYNVMVLRLPDRPTIENYSTEFFEYIINPDGTFAVDEIAIKKQGLSGPTYEKNMRDIFYSTYENLKGYLADYHPDYNKVTSDIKLYESISRIISICLSSIIFYIVIPLINKNGATLFEKVYDIGHVRGKNGYSIKPYMIILRAVINLTIPVIGIILFSKYSVILMTLFFIFINNLIFIFNKNNRDLSDLIINMDTCIVSESLIFKNRKKEKEYEESDEFKKIEEMTFIERLKEIKPITDKKENKE